LIVQRSLPLRPVRLWKTFRTKPNAIPVADKKCSPSHRNSVRLQTGMLFGITTEWCSALHRNRVRLRPDSAIFVDAIFPFGKHVGVNPYYEHQNNTGKSPNQQLNQLGLMLNLWF
jgi:hypothetical protein